MSLWDTNPSNNFCDPHWELICHNKWYPEISKTYTPLEIAVVKHFHGQHRTKTILVLLPADREATFKICSGGTLQPENTFSCILKVTSQTKGKHQH